MTPSLRSRLGRRRRRRRRHLSRGHRRLLRHPHPAAQPLPAPRAGVLPLPLPVLVRVIPGLREYLRRHNIESNPSLSKLSPPPCLPHALHLTLPNPSTHPLLPLFNFSKFPIDYGTSKGRGGTQAADLSRS